MTGRPTYPTAPPPWRVVGQVLASVTNSSGRAAIARLLQRASQGDRDAFEGADQIRQRLGLEWADLIEQRKAA